MLCIAIITEATGVVNLLLRFICQASNAVVGSNNAEAQSHS
jgi:hypothetical protein